MMDEALGPPVPLASRIESAVRDVFEKRLGGQVMPYEQARELVWLESEVVDELVFRLVPRSAAQPDVAREFPDLGQEAASALLTAAQRRGPTPCQD